jgi:tRNA dimethylallyltransferase
MSTDILIPIICGPTGSGKTAIALELAKTFPLEIISADSRQLIRKLDIGTAKPTKEEQASVPFHLIDITDPGEKYTAYRFIEDAERAIAKILSEDKLPVLVGGTGLYLRALTEGILEIENENPEVRAKLEKEIAEIGSEKLYEKLRQIDPPEAEQFHPNNIVRLLRALEIYRLTGKPKSEIVKSADYKKSSYNFRYYCLLPEREELYQKIELRVDQMLADGLLQELKQLVADNFTKPVRSMNVIGYNELLKYLEGELTHEEAVGLIKQNSRRYAKRQYTWFRNQLEGEFFVGKKPLIEQFRQDYSNFEQ